MNPKEQARSGWKEGYRMCGVQKGLHMLNSRGERERAVNSEK